MGWILRSNGKIVIIVNNNKNNNNNYNKKGVQLSSVFALNPAPIQISHMVIIKTKTTIS